MREIKFRAWDSRTRIMHQDVNPFRWDFVIKNSWHRCEKSNGTGVLGSGGTEAEMLVPAVSYTNLMQFTWVLDKEGKEIYEGDVVKVEYGIGKVIFHAGCFMIEWIDDPESNMELLSMRDYKSGRPRKDIEIIGNVYQNPELKINQP